MRLPCFSPCLVSGFLLVQIILPSLGTSVSAVDEAGTRTETGTGIGTGIGTELGKIVSESLKARAIDSGGAGNETAKSNSVIQSEKPHLFRNLESLQLLLNSSTEYNTIEELVEDLEHWRAPEKMRKDYPYYLSGHDDDGRPIWIGEVGKWNVRKAVEAGGETLKNFEKYSRQCQYRAIQSLQNKASPDDEELEAVVIADFDELSIAQLAHLPTLTFGLKLLKDFEPLINKHTAAGFFINANYVTERLIEISRPILGAAFGKIEVYGNNRDKWIPRLLRRLPKDQLPVWYGGYKHFQPIAVYG